MLLRRLGSNRWGPSLSRAVATITVISFALGSAPRLTDRQSQRATGGHSPLAPVSGLARTFGAMKRRSTLGRLFTYSKDTLIVAKETEDVLRCKGPHR